MIFHSYVKLPEGNKEITQVTSFWSWRKYCLGGKLLNKYVTVIRGWHGPPCFCFKNAGGRKDIDDIEHWVDTTSHDVALYSQLRLCMTWEQLENIDHCSWMDILKLVMCAHVIACAMFKTGFALMIDAWPSRLGLVIDSNDSSNCIYYFGLVLANTPDRLKPFDFSFHWDDPKSALWNTGRRSRSCSSVLSNGAFKMGDLEPGAKTIPSNPGSTLRFRAGKIIERFSKWVRFSIATFD